MWSPGGIKTEMADPPVTTHPFLGAIRLSLWQGLSGPRTGATVPVGAWITFKTKCGAARPGKRNGRTGIETDTGEPKP